jgi:hypothetical protein
MKTSKFIKEVEELGFTVNTVENYYVILNKILVCAEICRTSNRVNLFHECLEKNDLLKICVEYARTPIEEREEEKKFYLQKIKSFYDLDYNEVCAFLNFDMSEDVFCISTMGGDHMFKTQFTQKEIDKIKEEQHTDLSEFKQIPAEEIEA